MFHQIDPIMSLEYNIPMEKKIKKGPERKPAGEVEVIDVRRRRGAADSINCWGNCEIFPGEYPVDEGEAIDEALRYGLKAKKLG